MVLPRVRNHRAFQRAAILLIGTGAATTWVCAGAGPELRRLLFVVVAVVATAAAHQQGRSLWFAAGVALAGSTLAAVLWPGLSVAAAALAGVSPWGADGEGNPVAGALFGLVVGLGLFFAHLERRAKDAVRSTNTKNLDQAARALLSRAARAHERICVELADDRSAAAQTLVDDANRIAEGVLDLAARASQLRLILAALHRERRRGEDDGLDANANVSVDAAVPRDATGVSMTGAAGSAGDGANASEPLASPIFSASAMSPVLTDLEAAADRLQSEVRTHVVALERTALELLGRRAGRIAEAAAALTPVARQLVDGGEHLRAQTTALADLNAGQADSLPKT